MLDEIEKLRVKLNEMVISDNAVLNSGEILRLSERLDCLIVAYQLVLPLCS